MNNDKLTATDTFGGQLAKLRNSRGLTQSTLAANAEISTSYYSAIEGNKRLPPPGETLTRILTALSCTEAEVNTLLEMAAAERVISTFICHLPADVQALIGDIRINGHALPSDFVRALRVHIREAIN